MSDNNNNDSNNSNFTSQIFKNMIPTEKFFELLEKICLKGTNFYVVDNNAYKKGIYTNNISEFFKFCKPYYYIAKRKYLEREITNKSFITVVRQICKFNKIIFKSCISYDKTNYDIVYHIYYK